MLNEMAIHRYQVGGSLNHQDVNYVTRDADKELLQALQQGDFCYVFNSRQMGKSSLLVKTKHHLEVKNTCCVAIDLTGIGSDRVTPEQWYKGIIYQLYLGVNLSSKVNLKKWLLEQADNSLIQRLNNFLLDILLPGIGNRNLVIFIDELDSIFKLPFPTDDLFAFIRFCYNQRVINAEYQRLTWAMFGVATPSQLISDRQRTPFNIGRGIALNGFTLEQGQVLTKGFPYSFEIKQKVLESILYWTQGQPFLTQKICQLIVENYSEINESNKVKKIVTNLVRDRVIFNWEQQDDPEHLRTISNRLLHDDKITLSVLGTYQEILWGSKVIADRSIEHRELLLSGLVENCEGILKVKNPIYQAIFNLKWVANNLESFRPYALTFNNWIASKKQNNSCLLAGSSLESALHWSKDKRLGNLDYQFITASQELAKQKIKFHLEQEKIAKRQVEIALEAATEAHHILAKLKIYTQKKIQNFRLKKILLVTIVIVVGSCLALIRSMGIFQALELNTFDLLTKITAPNLIVNQTVQTPITVIGIEESDIQKIAQYPIPDRILAQAIKNLTQYKPSVIGLDIYRDLPVEPGNAELTTIFQNTNNLIGVEKLIKKKVNPPPALADLSQIGFNDLVLDPDAKIRRALLSYQPQNESLQFSFALKLALGYLKSYDINPEYISKNDSKVRLGKTIITPLQKNSGGYINAKTGGYQILIEYSGGHNHFTTYSLSDVLDNKVPKTAIENKIILIGATAESLNDFFRTAHHNQQLMSGVYIHANIIQQIIQIALYHRGLIKVLPEILEIVWLSLWVAIGASLSWLLLNIYKIFTATCGALLSLVIIVYFAWLIGYWLPLIPAFFGFAIALTTTYWLTNKQKANLELEYTIKLLLDMSREQPAASKIALEYLKIGSDSAKIASIISNN